jgi:tRNA pseudouridine55 synthase
MSEYFGVINLNKPHGMTSRQAVDHVKRIVRPAKTGHAGTLDPLAAGVLVVCVGPATRLIEYVQAMPKCYTATFLLGRESASEDLETEVIELRDPPIPSIDGIEEVCRQFTGIIEQRPPIFSALKVDGKRAYRLARSGTAVELTARPVTIHALAVRRYAYPELTLDITCSAGTYIRSLGRDVGLSLGSAAVMSHLVRTAVGSYTVGCAIEPQSLTRENLPQCLEPPMTALSEMEQVVLNDPQRERVAAGMMLQFEDCSAPEVAALGHAGDLIAILTRRLDGLYCPTRNFIGRG